MTRFPETKEVKLEFLLLTKSTAFIIGPVATALGWIMDFIYNICSAIGIQNIGLCIILFTIIVNLLTLPLTIKQQKFTKLNSVMNPEIQEIQKKYLSHYSCILSVSNHFSKGRINHRRNHLQGRGK